MALNIITLRIQADYEDAKAKLAAADKDIAALSQRAQDVGGKFTAWGKALMPVSLAVGAIGTGIITMARRGSEIGDVAQQFDVLSKRARETGETMLGALRRGTQGAVTDFALMQAANRAMGGGLQVSAKDMQTLAAGAKLLSDATGTDAASAFETLTSAITKGRVASLSTLGLQVEHVKGANLQSEVLASLSERLSLAGASQASFGDRLEGATTRLTNMIDRISVMASNSKGLADVIDIVTRGLGVMLTVVETVAGWFAQLPAPVQAVVVVLGGLVAAAGPVLFIVGQLITAFGAIVPLFAAGTTGASVLAGAMALITGPVGMVVAAVAGLIAIWVKWGDDIKRITGEAYTAVKTWLWDKLEPVLTPIIGLIQSVGAMFSAFGDLVGAIAGKVFGWIYDKIAGAFNFMAEVVRTVVGTVSSLIAKIPDSLLPLLGPIGLVITAFRKWDEIKTIASAVYTAVKLYLVDKFNAIVDSIKAKVDAVTGFFKDMYMKVVGGSFVPDLITGVGTWFGKLPQVMVAPAQAAVDQVTGAFGGLVTSLDGKLKSISPMLAGLPGMLMGALQSGGNVLGSMGSGLMGNLTSMFSGLFGAGGGLNTLLNNGLSDMATKIGGNFVPKLAGVLSNLIPGLGPMLGPLLGSVAGKVVGFIGGVFSGGNDTKKDREKLAGLMGFSSLDGLYQELRSMGEEGQRLVELGLNKIGKKDKGANAEWIEDVRRLFATYEDEAEAVVESTGQNAEEVKKKLFGTAESLTGSLRKLFKDPFQLKAELNKNSVLGAAEALKGDIEDLFRDPFNFHFEYDRPGGGPRGDDMNYAARGGLVTQRGIQYLGTGGWVRRGSDSVRAMLTPGEFVVSRKGVAALAALNRGDAGTLAGGQVEQTIQVQIGQETVLDTVIYGLKPRLRLLGVR